ncbi:hypothetical protein [Rhodococcus sp. P1Y]|uniref:hypothetical protein n=1 Tax=Rhodococcus sp. P1Y TaxID=1302308 RepID=UPI000EAF567A|nr:hypothetical protein [Rhodococcus sp. P1Y]AYJ50342.1 hypothetical protein D8W71_20960 [Rhodococcus sp. P1Y]
MAKALLLAWSTPASEESIDEFNRWYDELHIPQTKQAVPSIGTVTRYRLADPSGSTSPTRFLTVYELDESDVERANEVLMDAAKNGRLDATETMDRTIDPPKLEWYVQHTSSTDQQEK